MSSPKPSIKSTSSLPFGEPHENPPKGGHPILLSLAVVACIVGLGLSIELMRIHINVHTNPATQSFCSINKGVNCLNVAESPYSIFLGVPVAVWAILGELSLLLAASVALLTTVQARRRGISPKTPALGTGVLFMGTWVAVGSGLILSYLSTFIIKSLCLLCAGLEVSNIVLAILMLLYIRRARLSPLEPLLKDFRFAGGHLKIAAPVVAVFFATSAGLLAAYPSYWEILEPHGPGDLPHGFTDEGHPWIGAEKPKATIMEFTDFQCPFCQNAHAYARRMVEKYPHKVRLIHRDFPLDHHCNPEVTKPYHLRACQLSKAARCAGEQKKYWEMADLIFSRRDRQGGPDPYALAFRLDLDKDAFSKCMRSKKVHEALMRDINKANRLGLQGTPTYFINGNLLRSWPTEPIIKVFLEES